VTNSNTPQFDLAAVGRSAVIGAFVFGAVAGVSQIPAVRRLAESPQLRNAACEMLVRALQDRGNGFSTVTL